MIILKKIWKLFIYMIIIVCIFMIFINVLIFRSTIDQINTDIDQADCILVLGAGVSNGQPSQMLQERLDEAIALYKAGKADKIIMSGDYQDSSYDEVTVMKNYAVAQGVDSNDIFKDYAGYSTYESIYRAQAVYQADSIIVVSQEYHLYRALFIANALGIDAVGYSTGSQTYSLSQISREIREVLARCKDFTYTIIQPKPLSVTRVIPLTGSGDLTNHYIV